MTPYWLTFTDSTGGCCEGKTLVQAIIRAEDLTGKVVANARCIPYPAVPVLYQESNTPAFCHSPQKCLGKSSCPMDLACND